MSSRTWLMLVLVVGLLTGLGVGMASGPHRPRNRWWLTSGDASVSDAAADSGVDCGGADPPPECSEFAVITLTTLCGDATPENPEALASTPCDVIGTASHSFGIDYVEFSLAGQPFANCAGTESWTCTITCPDSGNGYFLDINAVPNIVGVDGQSSLNYVVDCP